jgi:hypothetical protein
LEGFDEGAHSMEYFDYLESHKLLLFDAPVQSQSSLMWFALSEEFAVEGESTTTTITNAYNPLERLALTSRFSSHWRTSMRARARST